jgi:hypothetical protein
LQIQVIGSHSLIPKTIYTRSPLIYLKFWLSWIKSYNQNLSRTAGATR